MEIHTEVMRDIQKNTRSVATAKALFPEANQVHYIKKKKKDESTHLTTQLLVKSAVNLESQGCTEMDI